jgi:hypothetical protein
LAPVSRHERNAFPLGENADYSPKKALGLLLGND